MRASFLLLAIVPLAACDDGFGPQEWFDQPDTVMVHSLSRPELLGMPSAYDFTSPPPVPRVVESPGASGLWDIALGEENGQFVFLPAGIFPGMDDRAGIAVITGETFENLRRAPGESEQFKNTAVPVVLNQVYAIRTRQASCGFTAGVRYGKLQPIEINQAEGWVRFRAVVNPYCSDRRLFSPD